MLPTHAPRSTIRGRLQPRALFLLLPMALAGCVATMPSVGGGSATPVTGSTAGASAVGASSQLEKCSKPLGVVRIQEDTHAEWYRYYYSRVGSTAPVLNMLIMQSNCFVVVERGTGDASIRDETGRSRGDEARESATRGKGQQVSADYLLKPEIILNQRGGQGGSLGGILPGVLGRVGLTSNEAGTVLTLVDIRSTVRLAAAEGYSKNTDLKIAGGLWGFGGAAGGSAFSRTDEGKVLTAAFFDAYNKLVVALRQYKAQTVKGGLGEGGELGVQGGSTAASKAVDAKSSPRPQTPVKR
ncbi:MAG TPA: CsgG/HfaB family protein [Rubrivivax sp.]|jgi:curli biogenesis system outer membrane secretion channel CsgG|nr:CsgG/HfaB family protein [Rubrivivax sp.]